MGVGLGNALAAVADEAALTCLRRLNARLGDTEGTVATLKRNNVLTASGVTPATYTYATITVDAAGRVTAASSGAPVVAETGASILAKLVTVDGSGSGLDADFLDGFSSAAFQPAGFYPTGSGISTGTNTGDQTITLTGEVTGSGTGSFAASITRSTAFAWTGIHTHSAQDVHNAGVSLGTSGRLNSAVTDAAAAVAFLVKPTNSFTSGIDRYIYQLQDSAGTFLWSIAADGSIGSQLTAHTGSALMEIGSSALTLPTANMYLGIKFGPKWGAIAGATIASITNASSAAVFSAADNASATATTLIGGFFTNQGLANRAHTNLVGGIFKAFDGNLSTGSPTAHGDLMGWWVRGVGTGMSTTATAIYGGRIDALLTGATPATTDAYGLFIAEQVQATNKYGLFLANATAGYKAIAIRDTNAWIGSAAAGEITVGGTNFRATSTNQAFFSAAAIAQPTTAIAASIFVANTSLIVNDSATWDGYTVGQVVKALRNLGLLA